MPKKLTILGSTGKVGKYTLEVIDQNPEDFEIVGLACYGSSHEKLVNFAEQVKKYNPKVISVYAGGIKPLREFGVPSDVEILTGEEGNIEISTHKDIDAVVTALSGSKGIMPTYEAIKAGKDIYLANKETLVVAGKQILEEARENDVTVMPLDDEPVAVLQSIARGNDIKYMETGDIEKILVSCSGGPFLTETREQIAEKKIEEILKHPKFVMGPKISIESALLWNKANEVVQISQYFDIPPEDIEVFVHPQAIIHGGVQYKDGNISLGAWKPSTKYAIAWALHYPETKENDFERVDLFQEAKFEFKRPDLKKFPCLDYGYQSLEKGGSMPAAAYFASDVATDAVAVGKIGLLDVEKAIKNALDTHEVIENPTLDQLLALEKPIKEETRKLLNI